MSSKNLKKNSSQNTLRKKKIYYFSDLDESEEALAVDDSISESLQVEKKVYLFLKFKLFNLSRSFPPAIFREIEYL